MGLAMTVIRIAAIPDLPSSLGVRTVMLSYEVVRVEAAFRQTAQKNLLPPER
jgi:hypothetical protein